MAFSDVQLTLESDAGPTSCIQVVSLRAPVAVDPEQRLFGYWQNLTMGISRSPDVRVLIVSDLAGTVKTVEFDFEGEAGSAAELPLKSCRVVSVQGVERGGAGAVGLFGPVADYVATMSITIQRRTQQGQGIVAIDGLDVSALVSPRS
ncbi:MAG: hypothetical protein F2840_13155 [Actinobacteria bacterium]|uniref:Unannotated protein n=1 Tax=freshwater metagenome TaxID=449393 RepID=A0A6J7LH79_9ZZZZ|nr:hypothetical protein [Actinomycetota bacterium]